jgi:hypothetical protein
MSALEKALPKSEFSVKEPHLHLRSFHDAKPSNEHHLCTRPPLLNQLSDDAADMKMHACCILIRAGVSQARISRVQLASS